MMRTRIAILAAVAAAITGCAPVMSSHPVGEEVPFIHADEWEGRWSFTDDSEQVFEIEVVDPGNGVLTVAVHPTDSNVRPLTTYLRCSGSDLFINMRGDGELGGYAWLRIANHDDTLIIWQPDVSKFRRLVDTGILPGRTAGKTVTLDGLSREHVALIASDAEGVLFDWKNPGVLHRVSR